MFQVLRNAWKITDLRKKILYTLFIILIFRIGSAITIPFIDAAAIAAVSAAVPVQAPAPAAAPAPAREEAPAVTAPLVGTFYTAPAPDQAPFVAVGDRVKKGQTVCLIEAMKMMSEIPAPMDCVIEEILVENGSLAGYDAPLFRVRRV